MPLVTRPTTSNGFIVEVVIGLPGKDASTLLASGHPVPAPIQVTALIDTGSNITCVPASVLQKLGLTSYADSTTHGVGGSLTVRLFKVSLSVTDVGRFLHTEAEMSVMELVQPPDEADVMLGRDVLSHG